MTDVRRARTAFAWVGVIVPLSLLVIASVIIATWMPALPDPVATHWGTDGVNGYGPRWTYLALTLGVGGGMVVLFAAMAVFSQRMPPRSRTLSPTRAPAPQWSSTARLLGGINLGVAGMFAVLMLVSVAVQRGLDDAAKAPDITVWAIIGFVVAIALTALGWFLQPKVPAANDDERPASPMSLAPGERAAWFGTAAMSRIGIISLIVAVMLLIGTTIWVFALDHGGAGWIIAVVTLLVVLLICATLVFHVRISSAGLRVRSIAGWPRWNIRAEQITAVKALHVNPMGEFGGWGLRIAVDGRMGVVLRTGEGIQITRKNGRVFVVTIDDARTAASVLTAAVNDADRGAEQGEN